MVQQRFGRVQQLLPISKGDMKPAWARQVVGASFFQFMKGKTLQFRVTMCKSTFPTKATALFPIVTHACLLFFGLQFAANSG